MIIDALLRLSSAQAFTTGANASTNVIDLGITRDLGVGNERLQLACSVATTFTSGGAGTLTIAAQGSVDNSAWTTYLTGPTYALATLVAGAQLMPISWWAPPAGVARPRYIRLLYTVATADFTAGALNADLVIERGFVGTYPAGINPAV